MNNDFDWTLEKTRSGWWHFRHGHPADLPWAPHSKPVAHRPTWDKNVWVCPRCKQSPPRHLVVARALLVMGEHD